MSRETDDDKLDRDIFRRRVYGNCDWCCDKIENNSVAYIVKSKFGERQFCSYDCLKKYKEENE